MKPFDLEAAKQGKKVVGIHGEEFKFLLHVPEAAEDYRVVLLDTSRGWVHAFTEDGKFYSYDGSPFLGMAKEKKTVYVNFYRGDECYHYSDKRTAERNAGTSCISVAVPVEIEV